MFDYRKYINKLYLELYQIRTIYAMISYINKSGKILPPMRYILELTYRCNLQCPFCYLEQKVSKNELNTQEWFDIIRQIPRYGFISLLGGEIFLRNDFFEIMQAASKRVFGKVNIYSNGTLLNEDKINDLMSNKFLLYSVSLDGYGDRHDELREQAGIFEEIISGLELIKTKRGKNKKPLLEVKSVILENNLDELPKIYRLCDEMELDYLTLAFKRASNLRQCPVLENDISAECYSKEYPVESYFDMEHFSEVYKELMSIAKKSKTVLSWAPKFNGKDNLQSIKKVFTNGNADLKTLYEPCTFPFMDIFINPEGIVYPCLAINMGSAKEHKLKEIYNCQKFKSFRKKLKEEKVFKPCNLCCDLYPKK
ncbi:MAG: radical SAM protein [Candidatus Gastranaerophilales bacterium]|nr:radical SAM protein [Candidatus Gastranaerophilales bacterium]